ncbi:hypothetical protein [Cryobacterium shii]|uniref:Uncharacterized protein n=1 Tax=Cryobacterium shii TaxID=1259235 RepID=A0AAQ2C5Q9_9MICO|nr:hypothetical protein [Cryobacterium shii]TFC45886.1 hypothetical protein E3O49_10240 [Cryobacterium shii]
MSRDSGATRLVRMAAQVPGSVFGAALGLTFAGPTGAILGAVSGTVLSQVGADIADRTLSPRQELRVGAVFLSAASAITVKQLEGHTLRDDGFFDGTDSNGAEFVEGVMLAAMDAYEERKVPYLGNLIANVSFAEHIDAPSAHAALRRADDLSWLELRILGIFDDGESYPMPARPIPKSSDWPTWTVAKALQELINPPKSLLKNARSTGSRGQMGYDLNLDAISMQSGGTLICGLMELGSIPKSDRSPIFEMLSRDQEPEEHEAAEFGSAQRA